MSGPIQEALKTLNESIALLDKNKHLIDEETYSIMKENLQNVSKNINLATKGINDDVFNDDDFKDDDTSNINFSFPFTLVVTHNTSFDILFDITECMWHRMDNIGRDSISILKGNWREAKEYNIQQALLHNIDPKNEDVIYFNHHFGQAMFYWSFGFDKTWYRNSATFHLEGGPEYL